MMKPTGAMVTGRRVTDYKRCRQAIPPDRRIYRCPCGTKVVVSPEAVAYMEPFPPDRRVVLCTPCAEAVAELRPKVAGAVMTKVCSEAMERSPERGKRVLAMHDKLRYPVE